MQSRLVRFGYVCLLAALAWTLFWPAPSRAGLSLRQVPQTQNWSSSTSADEQVFVVYRNERGEFACRDATKTERERISGRRRGGSTRLIYDGAAKQRSKSGTQKSTSVPTPDLALQFDNLAEVVNGRKVANLHDQSASSGKRSCNVRITGRFGGIR